MRSIHNSQHSFGYKQNSSFDQQIKPFLLIDKDDPYDFNINKKKSNKKRLTISKKLVNSLDKNNLKMSSFSISLDR